MVFGHFAESFVSSYMEGLRWMEVDCDDDDGGEYVKAKVKAEEVPWRERYEIRGTKLPLI